MGPSWSFRAWHETGCRSFSSRGTTKRTKYVEIFLYLTSLAMRALLPLIAVASIFLLKFSLAQTDTDVIIELCNAWQNPAGWETDCDFTTACRTPTPYFGIGCDGGRVIQLFVISLEQTTLFHGWLPFSSRHRLLDSRGLNGTIPESIGNLSHLKTLYDIHSSVEIS